MDSRASASASLTWSLIFVHSSIADHLLVRAQPIQAGTEYMDNGEQVLHQLLFRGKHIPVKDIPVHDKHFRAMAFCERSEPLEAKAHQPVLMGNDQPSHLP